MKKLIWADLVVVVIFVTIPVVYILDFLIDGCVSKPLGTGSVVCGDEAKEDVISIVGGFILFGAILGFKSIENKVSKKTRFILIALFVLVTSSFVFVRDWYKNT